MTFQFGNQCKTKHDLEAAEVQRDVDVFLASGGKIQIIPKGVGTYNPIGQGAKPIRVKRYGRSKKLNVT